MTATLLALYKKPDDTQAFDEHYFQTHVPLSEKMPGLVSAQYHQIVGSPMGKTDYHLLAVMTFESKAALDAAMKSPEGMAAAKDLMGFAGNLVHLMISEPANAKETAHKATAEV